MKLNLPPDNPPEWFPGRRVLPPTVTSQERVSTITQSDRQPDPQPPPERQTQQTPAVQQNPQSRPLKRALLSTGQSTAQPGSSRSVHSLINDGAPHPLANILEEQIEAEDLLDDDDFLLASAVENFENMASAGTSNATQSKCSSIRD